MLTTADWVSDLELEFCEVCEKDEFNCCCDLLDDDSGEQSVVEHSLFDFQWEMFNDKSRFKVVCAGRRTGKSHYTIVEAIEECCEYPNSFVLIIGPTYAQVREAFWKNLCHMIDVAWMATAPFKSFLEINFINGSRILLKGSDNQQKLRGMSPSPTLIICDEFREYTHDFLEEIIMPITSDPMSMARIIVISTPDGIGTPFHDLFENCGTEGWEDWKRFQFSALDVRPDMREEIEKRRRQVSPKTFAQEWLAEFIPRGAMVFYEFDYNKHIKRGLEWFKPNEEIHICIDFNLQIMAASAFAVRERIRVEFLWEAQGDANTDELIKTIQGAFPNRRIFVYPDPAGASGSTSASIGVTDISKLRKAGFIVRVKTSHPTIRDSSNAVNAKLLNADNEVNLFVDSKLKQVIRSLSSTKWKKTQNSEELDRQTIDKSQGVEHHSDGIRYAIDYLFPIIHRGKIVHQGKTF